MRGCTCDGSPALCPRCQYFATYATRGDPVGARLQPAPPAPPRRTRAPRPVPSIPPTSYRSKTEQRFAQLCQVWHYEGMGVAQWWYEPCKGLYLTATTSYTPDFLLQLTPPTDALPFAPLLPPDAPSVFIEVKGYLREKDWRTAKFAAARYPLWPFVLAEYARGHWTYTRIPPL